MALAKVPKPPRIPNPLEVKMMEKLDDQSAVKQEYLKRLTLTEYGVDGPCLPEKSVTAKANESAGTNDQVPPIPNSK